MSEKQIKHPNRARYCVTKTTGYMIFMTAISEEDAVALHKNSKTELTLNNHLITRFNTIETLGDASDIEDMSTDLTSTLKQYFGADRITTKPSNLNYKTMMGDKAKYTECCGFLDHYLYGLAVLGNPKNVVIYKVPRVKYSEQ